MWLGWLLAVDVLAVLSLGAVAAIRWLARGAAASARAHGSDPAQAVRRERDARAEIGREEFQRMPSGLS
jgi:uncharacterized membrane protein